MLSDLLRAIRESASASRVVVTCRYRFALPGPAGLYPEALESLRGADLLKKLARLSALSPKAEVEPALRERATALAGGNPRLLERLNTVLADEATDHAAVLAAIEEVAGAFREEILLRTLLDLQTPECRTTLARAAVYALPVSREAIQAAAGDIPVDPHLARASAVGLVESIPDPKTGGTLYHVASLVAEMLVAELPPDEFQTAAAQAARQLYREWWLPEIQLAIEQALELHRLALTAAEAEIAVDLANRIALFWLSKSRFREAQRICRDTLELTEDYRLLFELAHAEEVLAGATEARDLYELALARCPVSDDSEIEETRANILSGLARIRMRRGEIEAAVELLDQALQIHEEIGDLEGKAGVLASLAVPIAQQGDMARGFEYLTQAAEILKESGNDYFKAGTFSNIAALAAQRGDYAFSIKTWD